MIWIENKVKELAINAIKNLYEVEIDEAVLAINKTRSEFEGEVTIVVFSILKYIKGNPVEIGNAIGNYLVDQSETIEKFNVQKGFLNLSISKETWLSNFKFILNNPDFAFEKKESKEKIVLEYCGPNTNKPLHFGHVRNMTVGYSVAEILKAYGHRVHKVNILNDRGIAICKSMLAWNKYGEGETPASSGMKGDHFVGKYYVVFANRLKEQIQDLVSQGIDEKEAKKQAPLQKEAQEMLVKWESGDEEIIALWSKMNNWVYEGFDVTYDKLGIDFEKAYAESDYYLKGKDLVKEGLDQGLFFKKEDDSIWVDLTDKGEDQKILLRADGTSVYLTQDLGVAEARYKDFGMKKSIYVVGDEQNYHFKVLQLTLEKLQKPYADGIYHLAYGMVDLPGGAKMKSREGTTVDADDLIAEVIEKAKVSTLESGKIDDFSAEDQQALFETIGIGAIKFFILSVNPKKRMIFDPEESVSLNGFTAPAIQYAYTRTQSVLQKYKQTPNSDFDIENYNIAKEEKDVIQLLYQFKKVISDAAKNYDPSLIAHHAYNLRTTYNKFYENCRVLDDDEVITTNFRVNLCKAVGIQIKQSLKLLGIKSPERM